MNPGMAGEILLGHFLNHRREMDRIDQFGLWKILRDPTQRLHNMLHRFSIVLSAVTGDQDDFLSGIVQLVQQLGMELVIWANRSLQRINHGISRNKNAVLDPLPCQVFPIGLGRAEMELSQVTDQGPVHLLREGRIPVPGP